VSVLKSDGFSLADVPSDVLFAFLHAHNRFLH